MKPFAALISLLFAAASQTGQAAAPTADLETLLAPIRERAELPALTGAIATGAGELRIGAVGVRANGLDVPVTVQDRFHLGSCTKSMTATVAAILIERDELGWDTTLGEVFGAAVPDMQAAWREVTLEQLLAHRSGLRRDPKRLWHLAPARELRAEIVAALLREAPEKPPGTETSYSNAGFIVAGAMLETVTGRSWEELMRTELFEPLELTGIGFGAPDSKHTRGAPLQPRGHLANRDPIRGWDSPPYYGPAGTVHAPLADWGAYLVQHLRGARGEESLLKPDSFEHLHRDHGGGYGLGWGVGTATWAVAEDGGAGRVLRHAGSNGRWYCFTRIVPEHDFVVMAATNWAGETARKACEEAAWALTQDQLARLTDTR